MTDKNRLHYGDNLSVLRGTDSEGKPYIPSDSVDLIYLDPPFNSRQDYNVLFAEKDGSRSASQVTAFKDSWEWNEEAALAYEQVVEQGGTVANAMRAFRTLLGGSDMLAYLAMMAPRLIELRRVLKPNGSIYIHCDSTASHYLKLLMDGVFGPTSFRNEIVWKRTNSHNDPKRFGQIHDTIFYYLKSPKAFQWNPAYIPYTAEYIESYFKNTDPDGRRFWANTLTAPGPRPNLEYEWKGHYPPAGRCWAMEKSKLEILEAENRIFYTKKGFPLRKYYLDEMKGAPVQDIWTDMPGLGGLSGNAAERLGYPTQKPEALLERILRASSNEGDVVLDPFCGCGTTVQVAQKLNRRWIGIDITHLAINLIKNRLSDTFGEEIKNSYVVIGEPKDLKGAEQLALENKYQFQYWALGKVDAQPAEPLKKGSDRGIDGRKFFHDERGADSKQIIFSVKGGRNIGVSEIRDLLGVLQREGAEIGVYISFEEPTRHMLREAAEAGFYSSPAGGKYPRLQLLTIRHLLEGGKTVEYPKLLDVTFKKAPKHRAAPATNLRLDLISSKDDS